MPGQTLCRGTLADLPRRTAGAVLKAPVLIVIGRVVAMAEVLAALPWQPEAAPCDMRQASHA